MRSYVGRLLSKRLTPPAISPPTAPAATARPAAAAVVALNISESAERERRRRVVRRGALIIGERLRRLRVLVVFLRFAIIIFCFFAVHEYECGDQYSAAD